MLKNVRDVSALVAIPHTNMKKELIQYALASQWVVATAVVAAPTSTAAIDIKTS
jgi:hypothetical protein